MSDYPSDIYTEPSNLDVRTLNNLGPLTRMAGIWQGTRGLDVKPKAEGAKKQAYVERIELQPIDPQTNGPQLFYGLRYHTLHHQARSGEDLSRPGGLLAVGAGHRRLIHTLTIPRGQTAMAYGQASADATQFELKATRGCETYGICSNPFLEHAFKTVEFRIKVTHQRRRHLVVRRRHGADDPRPGRAVPPHRPQHAQQDRRGDAQPAGARRLTVAAITRCRRCGAASSP